MIEFIDNDSPGHWLATYYSYLKINPIDFGKQIENVRFALRKLSTVQTKNSKAGKENQGERCT
jgi:hypothetical protein